MAETTEVPEALSPFDWGRVLPALRSRNFRLFWLGQSGSTLGTALQVVAEGWLIYDLTQSTFWLGMVGFIGLLPVVPIALLGGMLIDRVPRRKLIIATQIGLLAQAALFGLLALSGSLQLWHIIGLYFLFGALLAIDHPARRALLVDLVEAEELANAVALNASMFNIANLIGYAVAGLLIATVGAGGTMLINAATYLLPIYALTLIRIADTGRDRRTVPLQSALTEGFVVLWRQPAILGTISLMAVVGGLAWPVFGLMPAFAEAVLGTNAVGLGLLLATGAFGSVIGTVVVGRLGGRQRGRTMLWVSLLLPALVVGFALSPTMWLACLFLIPLGMTLLILQSLAITVVQLNIADRVRGRVISLYSMLHAGADTLGNVVIGSGAVYLGLPLALSLGGLLALGYTLAVWLLLPVMYRLE